ncbi:MAG: hypothetical protein HQ501_10320 [Rhodospirillales bacterium]|nr:hypothetical protein [Rhodospirillales bacterium]
MVSIVRFISILALGGWGLFAPAGLAAEEPFEGLPEGQGREATYFNCTACHSIQQVTQQGMDREDWGDTLDRMVASNNMHPMQPWARTMVLNYLATHYGTDDEDWLGLPPGNGRDEVFYTCQACHSLKTVQQQGLSKDSWKETLVWMVEEQGMSEPEPDELKLILDYLSTYYGIN